MYALFYGEQWLRQWDDAITYLVELHEAGAHTFPFDLLADSWEELWWRWTEEIRELDRQALRVLGDENPSYERYKWCLTVPQSDGTPWLKLPRTFHLSEPQGYFQIEIQSRNARKRERVLWDLVWAHKAGAGKTPPPPPLKRGGAEPPAAPPPKRTAGVSTAPPPDLRASKLVRLSYPEMARAHEHQTLDSGTSQAICWDAACWSGCKAPSGTCPRLHKSLGK